MRARRSTGTLPQAKAQTLIVVQAFKRNEEGELVPAIQAQEALDERRGIERARQLSLDYAGAIAWKRDANPDEGEFGNPVVLYARGQLPDLDMPVRVEDGGAEEGSAEAQEAEPGWMGMQLPAASDWKPFRDAFFALYRQQEDTDLLAIFTALENRRIVLLPPEAAKLVQRELPRYQLRPCERPPSDMISLELGHSLQLDTTWFDLSAEERQRRIDAQKLSPEEIEAEDSYFAEFWGLEPSTHPGNNTVQ